ncbi:hypothetical protein AAIB33_14310 [Microbacterium sp. AZCO]|uniref:hypothetical protein n=1 Tax=Microbacterium sp. AZCO TaxID=3142976 RepID=UPI0031F458D9
MTRQLDDFDTRITRRRPHLATAAPAVPHLGTAGPLRSDPFGEFDAPRRPGRLHSLAAAFATIGATGFSNPGEQIRVWTLWLSVINVGMAVALTLALVALFR